MRFTCLLFLVATISFAAPLESEHDENDDVELFFPIIARPSNPQGISGNIGTGQGVGVTGGRGVGLGAGIGGSVGGNGEGSIEQGVGVQAGRVGNIG